MLSSGALNSLLDPLIARSSWYRTANYSDRAADLVLERLEVNAVDHLKAMRSAAQTNSVSCWVDAKARVFFEANPRGQGIEVNCGISTRFYRMSERSDWPQFSWQTINRPDVDDCFKFAFPALDNFRSVACENPAESWLKFVNWKGVSSIFVVIGEAQTLSADGLKKLMQSLASIKNQQMINVELIVFHSVNALKPMLDSEKLKPLLLEEWGGCTSSLLAVVIRRLFFKSCQHRLCASFLKL